HAVDRGVDQFGLVRDLDIVGAHAIEHVAEQVELAICLGVGGVGRTVRSHGLNGENCCRRTDCKATEPGNYGSTHQPRTFSSLPAHHGLGSTEFPLLRNSTYKM